MPTEVQIASEFCGISQRDRFGSQRNVTLGNARRAVKGSIGRTTAPLRLGHINHDLDRFVFARAVQFIGIEDVIEWDLMGQ